MRYTTKRNGKNVIPMLMAVCGINLPYWRIDRADDLHSYLFGDAADKLAAYEDEEEQGLLIRLPCKVGDTFYYIAGTLRGNEYVASDTVAAIEISDTEPWIIDSCGCPHNEFWMTRKEAEAALKGERKDV